MATQRKKSGPINASEIERFLYCQRKWWYELQGEEPSPQSQEQREQGEQHHRKLAQRIQESQQAPKTKSEQSKLLQELEQTQLLMSKMIVQPRNNSRFKIAVWGVVILIALILALKILAGL